MNDKRLILWVFTLGESHNCRNRDGPLYLFLVYIVNVLIGNQQGPLLVKHILVLFVDQTREYNFLLVVTTGV